jgi:hypothetical protein
VRSQRNKARRGKPRSQALVELMVREMGSSARILELYYWAREKNLLHVMRTLVAVPETDRAHLELFLAMASDPNTITAVIDRDGCLKLSSPQASQGLAQMNELEQLTAPEISTQIH